MSTEPNPPKAPPAEPAKAPQDQDPKDKDLSRQGTIVASMTMLSRISGFVRDVVLSYFFGASYAADAFFVAFRIPNFFRRLFAEGAFSQAFVPVLARFRQRPLHELQKFVGHIFGNLGLALLAVMLVGWLTADYLILLFAPGFKDDPARYDLAVELVRITLPYLGLISLVAFASAILHAHDRFAVPAFTPVLLNLCLISGALIGIQLQASNGGEVGGAVIALGWGVLAAGALQLVFQLPSLQRLKMIQAPKPNIRDEGVRDVGRLLVPAVFAASVAQINTLVDTILASTLITGSISWLYYSDRLMELPVGLVAVTLGTILLPNLSSLAARNDAAAFQRTLDWGIRMALMLTVPAAVSLYLLSLPIFATIFMHGALTPTDAVMAGISLQAFAVGLIGWVLVKVLAPGYFAHKDTRTPFRIGVAAVALNIVLNLALFSWMGHLGLALATSASGLLNAGLLYRGLVRNGRYRPGMPVLLAALRTMVAALPMIAVLLWLTPPDAYWLSASVSDRVLTLSGLIALGALAFLLTLFSLGARPADFRFQLRT